MKKKKSSLPSFFFIGSERFRLLHYHFQRQVAPLKKKKIEIIKKKMNALEYFFFLPNNDSLDGTVGHGLNIFKSLV